MLGENGGGRRRAIGGHRGGPESGDIVAANQFLAPGKGFTDVFQDGDFAVLVPLQDPRR